MSKYTTEVRYICEVYAGLKKNTNFLGVNEVISKARSKIFQNSYPIFDETYRPVLESKILKHFYTREIGLETVGLWKLKLQTKMSEIMPYYNQMYKSQLLEFNPFYDVDLVRDHTADKNGSRNVNSTDKTNGNTNQTAHSETDGTDKNTGTISDSGKNKNMHSDTPQGAITDLESGKYMSDATIVDNSNTTTNDLTNIIHSSSDSSSETEIDNTVTGKSDTITADTEKYLEKVKGKQGTASYSDLLIRYRESFVNIDMMVIEELNDLFFNMW